MPAHTPLVCIMHLPVVSTVHPPPASASHVFSSVLADHTVQQDMQMVCALLHSNNYDRAMHTRVSPALSHKPRGVAAAAAQNTQVVTGVPAVCILQPQRQAVT